VPVSIALSTSPRTLRNAIWVLAGAYGVVALWWPPTSRLATTVADLLFFLATAAVSMTALVTARAAPPGSALRSSWSWFALAWAIAPVAMVSLLYRDFFAWGQPLPSLPRALYLLGYAGYWTAIAHYPVDVERPSASAARRIDQLTIATVAISVVGILGSTWLAGSSNDTVTRVTGIAFPLSDLTSMYLIARRLDRVQHRARRRALLLLAAALPFDLIIDLFYSEMLQVGPAAGALTTTLAYCFPFVCIGQAAYISGQPTTERALPSTSPIPFAPTMAVLTMWAIVIATLAGLAEIPLSYLLVPVGLVTALVVARQVIALRDATVALAARDRAEARFEAVVAHAVDATVLLDHRGTVLYASPSVEALLGIPPTRVVGRAISEFVVDAPHERLEVALDANAQGAVHQGDRLWRVRRADGTERTVEIAVADRRRDPALGAYILTARDVTERLALNTHLRERQTLEVVGRLAGGIAHDFNNLLAVVRGNAELLELGRDAVGTKDSAARIIDAADRGAALTSRLLGFTRQDADAPRLVAIDAVVVGAQPLLERLIAKGIVIECLCDAPGTAILIDPIELERALLNLAVNARDAMPNGGTLLIRTTATVDQVCLQVKDTGTGMDEKTRTRLFEPLFTTKPRGRGTGLGLHITRLAVERAGGSIAVESELGVGSQFTLSFPRAEGALSVSSVNVRSDRNLGEELAGRIALVVDDDAAICETLREGLTAFGMTVYPVDSVDAAEEWLSGPLATRCDIVVTDMVMPRRSGLELVEQLRLTAPLLPVLVLSGYVGDNETGLAAIRDDLTLLQKPFEMLTLATTIADLLRRPLPAAA
jgi:PAS domain S-box-containing protein